MSFFEQYKKIFIVGIAGAGTSALAHFLNSKGCYVYGSDVGYNKSLDDILGFVTVYKEYDEKNIDESFDLLIYSSVWGEDTPERKKAKELNIRQLNYFEALGEITKEFNTIAISGTNGKSTTTALTGILLADTEYDPNVVLGANVKDFDFTNNYRKGRTDNLVVEGCEYQAHMLELHPNIIILTNIEAEHLDYYKNLENIIKAFKEYAAKLAGGQTGTLETQKVLIYNADCKNTCEVAEYAKNLGVKTFSFGIDNDADLMAKNIIIENEKQYFDLYFNDESLGRFSLNIPGKFNISNLLGAIAGYFTISQFHNSTIEEKNKALEKIHKVCEKFNGLERRFEIIKKYGNENILYVLDYAHNPYKVEATLNGVKEFYKNRRVVAVFQPHTYDRTKKLFNEFVDSFYEADVIILPEIYEPKGRDTTSDKSISSLDLVNAIKDKYQKEVYFTKDLEETYKKIEEIKKENDLILIMGAGDINKIKI